ncbi:hypothetical protein [Streptomyces sp. 6-11-2]|uniref:hypothetical protein n=1 Tax=Streptomyces sp. 6-11-2 TaxID=2585753 RepID=UPI00116B0C96|nr:hypothetical protein [Streptomyces sp. 6-11-2]GED89941.1 hypothetical protein TNCT6_70260 [Streptomyces sp. 6-11-2]
MDPIEELAGLLAGGRLITDPEIIDGYRRDEAHTVVPGHPLAVLLATSTEEVSTAMRWAHAHGKPWCPAAPEPVWPAGQPLPTAASCSACPG